jgi:squalene synthase HpnD/squalene synthase HpnC
VEGQGPGHADGAVVMIETAAALRSGKTSRDENFPVASRLIKSRYRRPILAFYEFVRIADDIADHAHLSAEEKLTHLDRLEASLIGHERNEPVGVALRSALAEADVSARHACDLLAAFRLDAIKQRYQSWDELIDYCRLSAMPVGRFVLDVHGEAKDTWAASDPLCAALQVINHLQDCAADHRALDRVYLPLDLLERHGAAIEDLARPRTTPALRACFDDICNRIAELLRESAGLASQVRQARLGLEIAVIQRLAERLLQTLRQRDPLAERAALGSFGALRTGLLGLAGGASQRIVPLPALRIRRPIDKPNSGAQTTGASHSTFYAAMRILPRDKREALYSVYGFCRAVDDIADEPGDPGERLRRLDRWRNDIDGLYNGRVPPNLRPLSTAIAGFRLQRDDFQAVIDGMQMDVKEDICAPSYADLDLYCDRVASAVGRLCVRIFEIPERTGMELAHHLGRALQLTNILRDIDEDGAIGRVYLPHELLRSAGIAARNPRIILRHPALGEVCERLTQPALAHFDEAEAVMRSVDPGSVRCARIMAAAYRHLLVQLRQRGWAMPRAAVRLSRGQIVGIVLRTYLGR